MNLRGNFVQRVRDTAYLPFNFRVKTLKVRNIVLASLVEATRAKVTLIDYLVKKEREGWL